MGVESSGPELQAQSRDALDCTAVNLAYWDHHTRHDHAHLGLELEAAASHREAGHEEQHADDTPGHRRPHHVGEARQDQLGVQNKLDDTPKGGVEHRTHRKGRLGAITEEVEGKEGERTMR